VATNLVPLWEYSAAEGGLRFTHPVDNPAPVEKLLSRIGKYRHLDEDQIEHIQRSAQQRIKMLQSYQALEERT
jgi:phenylglyoxylate dehydrogenase beta subunit